MSLFGGATNADTEELSYAEDLIGRIQGQIDSSLADLGRIETLVGNLDSIIEQQQAL